MLNQNTYLKATERTISAPRSLKEEAEHLDSLLDEVLYNVSELKKCLKGEALYLLEDLAHDLRQKAYCAEQAAKNFQEKIDKETDLLYAEGLKGDAIKAEIKNKIMEG